MDPASEWLSPGNDGCSDMTGVRETRGGAGLDERIANVLPFPFSCRDVEAKDTTDLVVAVDPFLLGFGEVITDCSTVAAGDIEEVDPVPPVVEVEVAVVEEGTVANVFLTLENSEETYAKDVSSFSSSANGLPKVVRVCGSSLMLSTVLPLPPIFELLEDITLAVSIGDFS